MCARVCFEGGGGYFAIQQHTYTHVSHVHDDDDDDEGNEGISALSSHTITELFSLRSGSAVRRVRSVHSVSVLFCAYLGHHFPNCIEQDDQQCSVV